MSGAYGAVVLEHFRHPRNFGRLVAPDRAAEGAHPICGDRVRLELALAGNVVRDARFSGNACALCTASASLLTEWLRGRPVADAAALDDDTVFGWLGGAVPEARRGCALLPRDTLRRALGAGDRAREPRVVGLLLAAGRARRFGGQKLVASLNGQAIVRRAAETLLRELSDVVVVVALDDAGVRDALSSLPVQIVVNEVAEEGMASSIRAGVAAVRDRADGVAIALGDQPNIPAGAVAALRDAFAQRPDGVTIVAPLYDGGRERGHPVLFAAAVFGELAALSGDGGARGVLAHEPARVRWVAIDAEPPADVDTPADLAKMERARPRPPAG